MECVYNNYFSWSIGKNYGLYMKPFWFQFTLFSWLGSFWVRNPVAFKIFNLIGMSARLRMRGI